jgi:UDP-N-acetylmuramoylalanine--D-glutamate ligase
MSAQQRLDKLNLRGTRATVLGLGREGLALARFLVEQGVEVTVTDRKTAEELRSALESLTGLPVKYHLGGHPLAVLDCDVLFVSPGVPLDAPILLEARQRGLTLSSESRLFCRLCPAPVVGVTGSSGKTTTSTLVARMLEASGRRVHLGGNIGKPLLGRLRDIRPEDIVVAELSSFQLDFFGPMLVAEPRADLVSPLFPAGGWSPPFAAVLNVTPNHLDRHPTMDSYVAAKRKIIRYQLPQDHAVLSWDDPVAQGFAELCPGSVAFFSLDGMPPRGAYLKGDVLALREAEGETVVCSVQEVRLRGRHNVANVLAACAMSALLGAMPRHMADVVTSFSGVEHRLEPAGEWRGVWYYNDSIATSPERAMAALRSFSEPIVLLAGGRDKHLPWDDWADLVSHKVAQVVAFGEAAPLILQALRRLGQRTPPTHEVGGLAEAVKLAAHVAEPGQVVLLAPGAASFDEFHDYAERGETFKRLVRALCVEEHVES